MAAAVLAAWAICMRGNRHGACLRSCVHLLLVWMAQVMVKVLGGMHGSADLLYYCIAGAIFMLIYEWR